MGFSTGEVIDLGQVLPRTGLGVVPSTPEGLLVVVTFLALGVVPEPGILAVPGLVLLVPGSVPGSEPEVGLVPFRRWFRCQYSLISCTATLIVALPAGETATHVYLHLFLLSISF